VGCRRTQAGGVSHPLAGARLKVVRAAHEHLDAFKAESGAFLDTKPYRFESEAYDEHWWVKPRIAAPPADAPECDRRRLPHEPS
jgi:hypothetical protein